MIATVCKILDFPASHANDHHHGHCSRLHGHTWTLEIHCRGVLDTDPKSSSFGMVVDFADIKRVYEQHVEVKLEHQHLNDTLDLPEYTSEYVAAWIFQTMKPHLPSLVKIRLWEGKTSYAEVDSRSLNGTLEGARGGGVGANL